MAYRLLPMYNLAKPVGPNKPNLADDVALVKALFEIIRRASGFVPGDLPALDAGAAYTPALGQAILAEQRHVRKLGGNTFVADGFLSPIPSQSGVLGDVDAHFRNGASSLLMLMNIWAFKTNSPLFLQIGERLRLRWVPDPSES